MNPRVYLILLHLLTHHALTVPSAVISCTCNNYYIYTTIGLSLYSNHLQYYTYASFKYVMNAVIYMFIYVYVCQRMHAGMQDIYAIKSKGYTSSIHQNINRDLINTNLPVNRQSIVSSSYMPKTPLV